MNKLFSLKQKAQDLEYTLNHTKAFKSFYEFCKYEHSEENLAFYRAIEEFKNSRHLKQRKELIKEIFERFIFCGANLEINLNALTRKEIYDELSQNPNDPKLTIFDAAQLEVYRNLECDSWVRYLQNRTVKTKKRMRRVMTL